jgi:hypothetical protein
MNKEIKKKIESEADLEFNVNKFYYKNDIHDNEKKLQLPSKDKLKKLNFSTSKYNLIKNSFDVRRSEPHIIFPEINLKQNPDEDKLFPKDEKKVRNLTSLKIRYSVTELLLRTFCPCFMNRKQNLKNKLFSHGYNKFNYHMSVISYIRKMHEMDIMKYLMLNKNQINLFNFLSKPSVSNTSKTELTETLKEKFSCNFNEQEINRMYQSYQQMSRNPDSNEVDRKLMGIVISEVERLTDS